MTKNIIILGASGSIGKTTLALMEGRKEYILHGVSAHQDVKGLMAMVKKYRPALACLSCDDDKTMQKWRSAWDEIKNKEGKNTIWFFGKQGLISMATEPCDLLVVGVVGLAALPAVWHGLARGQKIALANKEAIVAGGQLMIKNNFLPQIIPIDSEHNAIFQCLMGQDKKMVKKIILTASGGPFLRRDKKTFDKITVEQAVNHPRWTMGKKISVDSATLFNKGLEVIEASYLFGFPSEQIDVVVHPESIIHSMVRFSDGSYLAQLGPSDMAVPIAFALAYPHRLDSHLKEISWHDMGALHFEKPDEKKFRSLSLAHMALRAGGNRPLVLNSSNELLVSAFLAGQIKFTAIEKGVEFMLHHYPDRPLKNLDDIMAEDEAVKSKMTTWIKTR